MYCCNMYEEFLFGFIVLLNMGGVNSVVQMSKPLHTNIRCEMIVKCTLAELMRFIIYNHYNVTLQNHKHENMCAYYSFYFLCLKHFI